MARNPFQVQGRKPDYRAPAHRRGYNSTWRKVRAAKLRHHPLCEECERQGRTIEAAEVHHKDENPMNNEPSNLESLCRSCHERTKRR